MDTIDGILLVDKPLAWTSFDVVAKVRGELKRAGVTKPKVGHTGTLDPLASGLLVLVIGTYCKRAQEFSKLDKTYEVTMKLGFTSTTGDNEGDKTKVSDQQVSLKDIERTLQMFTGDIEQTPPAYSAIKVNGQRAYKLARAGKEVILKPRPVAIHSIELTGYAYPEVKFTAHVSSGTYIRSLVEDIGEALGTGAYMSALRRTSVGPWAINGVVPIHNISSEIIISNLIRL